MTHATKAIYRLLLLDYVKVSNVSVEDMLFDEQDIIRSMDKIEVQYLIFAYLVVSGMCKCERLDPFGLAWNACSQYDDD